jgi:hypothetical protein
MPRLRNNAESYVVAGSKVMTGQGLANDKAAFLAELQRKRELVAGRVAKLDPSKKEYAWEKEELDDLDKAIKKLRSEVPMTGDNDEPRFF